MSSLSITPSGCGLCEACVSQISIYSKTTNIGGGKNIGGFLGFQNSKGGPANIGPVQSSPVNIGFFSRLGKVVVTVAHSYP